jgi:hypothetical protein
MDDKLKTLKYPLVFLSTLVKKKDKIDDEKFRLVFVKLITYQQDYFIDLNIVPLFSIIKNSHPETWKIVKTYQKVLKQNLLNFEGIRKYRKFVSKRFFNLSLEKQIKKWEEKLSLIKALDDSTFPTGDTFSIKLLLLENGNQELVDEMILRLAKFKEILSHSYFIKQKIVLFTTEEFEKFTWKEKTTLFLKFFQKIKKKIQEKIDLLKKTKNYLDILNEIYQIVI